MQWDAGLSGVVFRRLEPGFMWGPRYTKNLMISICFNWANLCILAKILSYLQGFKTISLKAINFTLTIQEILRPTIYCIVVQTLRSSRPFFKGQSFLIHLTMRSLTLNPFPLLRKKLKINLVSKYENSS